MNLMQYIIFGTIIILLLKENDKTYGININDEKCRNCGMDIPSTSLNCPHCHEEVKKTCENCGKIIGTDWRYCPFCKDEKIF